MLSLISNRVNKITAAMRLALKLDHSKCLLERMQTNGNSHRADGSINGHSHCGDIYYYSVKYKRTLQPSNFTSRQYSQRKSCDYVAVYKKGMFTAALFAIALNCKQQQNGYILVIQAVTKILCNIEKGMNHVCEPYKQNAEGKKTDESTHSIIPFIERSKPGKI